MPGVHIEWNSQAKHSCSKPEEIREPISDCSAMVSDESTSGAIEIASPSATEQHEDSEHPALIKRSTGKAVQPRPEKSSMPSWVKRAAVSPHRTISAQGMVSALPPDEDAKPDGFSIASLVLGVLSFFTIRFVSVIGPLLPLFPLLAMIFGAIGIHRTRHNPQLKGKGMAIAGLVLGILYTLLLILLVLVVIALLQ